MKKNNEPSVVAIIELFRGRLDDEWLNEYRSDAEHGEWGLAFENLCTQLFEFDIVPNDREYQAICKVGESMKIDPQRWVFLNPQKT